MKKIVQRGLDRSPRPTSACPCSVTSVPGSTWRKCQIRAHRHRFGGLYRPGRARRYRYTHAGKGSTFKLQVHQSLDFITRRLALGRIPVFFQAVKRQNLFSCSASSGLYEMRLAPDWNACSGGGPRPLATASVGFCPAGKSPAIRITSEPPARSKSTIRVEQRPETTNSSASAPTSSSTNRFQARGGWLPALEGIVCRNTKTAADCRMSYKVRALGEPVNVTAVIVGLVTEALCNP